jgi:prepilin-type processing-associated H-X9-DG protein
MSCSNKLKQLALACHLYHDSNQVFPIQGGYSQDLGVGAGPLQSGNPDHPSVNGRGQNGMSWLVRTLPFLEQQPLYDQFSPYFNSHFWFHMLPGDAGGVGSSGCREAVRTRLSELQCSSDDSATILSTDQFGWTGVEVALTNYKGVIGDTRVGAEWGPVHAGTEPDCHRNIHCRGIFFRQNYQNPVKISQVLDGTSSTFLLGEDLPEYNWHSTAFDANGSWSSCNSPPNYLVGQVPTPAEWWNVQGFRSRHPGGLTFALADGSVRFIQETIDYNLYRALSTRNAGEVVVTDEL